ncbi:UDP-N-acetylglucosamine 1-carboxyvinyltransferase [Halobacteriovorax sp. JY17]|uniref:UDP-N-acetylglucosamine 1-carboxyvinyltransferase n=1 Tax=Halobacteriovorax sp. JY17 TaxID=2014617 RepID=UPI000C5AADD3|nr:UDP-N-acetylglucosamine 1-carboxyvinyltransferase [Halobacteriovorax sp. JY17]PIK14973.1 MAG: UDP-N-acetylglucosamine 1-carboxyvinyltransferase [Halobacteriovorax sp. JY17]
MDKIIVDGPCKLEGSVKISKAKNAYLPILSGVLLSDKKITLNEIPNLRDINTMLTLLGNLGVGIERNGDSVVLDPSTLNSHEATYDLVKTMRASIFTLGPILTRLHKAKVSLPGGCAIGTRPIDLHLSNLEKMGAKITLEGGYVYAETDGPLKGAHLVLAFPSVGATENLMMAAVFAEGITTIENAALEPEIDDLANFLNAMGAKVTGIGTKKIQIEGVKELHEVNYTAIGDRIEAATYIMAALATKSNVKVTDFNPSHLEFVLDELKTMGAKLNIGDNFVEVLPSDLKACKVDTAPFPGFPTDVQAQMMALVTQVKGSSIITEHIFENRFMHVPELNRLGAHIELKGNTAFVEGESKLKGAPVMCTDLRASAALIIAALASEGKTEISRVYHLDRGYDNLASKLQDLGAKITRSAES